MQPEDPYLLLDVKPAYGRDPAPTSCAVRARPEAIPALTLLLDHSVGADHLRVDWRTSILRSESC